MSGAQPTIGKHSGSLRLRFLLAVMLWVLLGIGAIWVSSVRVFEKHVEQSFHEELEVHVRELARLTRIGSDGQPELTRPLSDPRYEVPLSGYYWQVTAPGMRPLRSESMTRGGLDQSIAHSPQIAHRLEGGPTGPAVTYGFVQPGAKGEDIHFVIATDQSELDRLISSFQRELTVWLVALGALLLATGIAIVTFGLRPLNRLGAAIARLRGGQSLVLEGRYPAEIAPLVSDLNEFIRHNGEMTTRARVQAGNLAHSLRTPLAVVMDEAERLAEGDRAPDSAKVLLDQAGMMQQQIEYQLARARSSVGARVPGRQSILPELLLPILGAMRRLHPDRQFSLSNRLRGEAVLPCDPIDLSELLSILLDNAGKWARSAVRIELEPSAAGGLAVTIADDGPGMTEEQVARAFEVGTRFDSGMPGSGLGLAIASEICAALAAELELVPSSAGLVAKLTFSEARV